jgi:hypothetical protein
MSAESNNAAETLIEVDLDRVFLSKGNAFHISLRFEDDSYLSLDFPPESNAHRRILGILTQVATQTLSGLGSSGILIAGITSAEAEDGSS